MRNKPEKPHQNKNQVLVGGLYLNFFSMVTTENLRFQKFLITNSWGPKNIAVCTNQRVNVSYSKKLIRKVIEQNKSTTCYKKIRVLKSTRKKRLVTQAGHSNLRGFNILNLNPSYMGHKQCSTICTA